MRPRYLATIVTLALFIIVLIPVHTIALADSRCFAETGQCVDGQFQAFWEQNDGFNRFGMPLTPLIWTLVDNDEVQVQWFERARLELHPDGIQLGRLGVELAAVEQHDFTPADAPQAGCRYFADVQHNVCGLFLKYWQGEGIQQRSHALTDAARLALWGRPISEAQIVATPDGASYTVQWFERARLEDYGERGVNVAMLSRDLHVDYNPPPAPTSKPLPPTATPVPIGNSQPAPTSQPGQPAPTQAPAPTTVPTVVPTNAPVPTDDPVSVAPTASSGDGTIICKDGYVWPGKTRQGACHGHGGIAP